MSTGMSAGVRRAIREEIVGYKPRSWVTLHMYDMWDPAAERDRRAGIFGQQIDNRQHLGEDMKASLVNYYPDQVLAHWVLWHDGAPLASSPPVQLLPLDVLDFDARRDINIW